MKVTFSFVPPGGGEANYELEFDLPAIPQPGDYIKIMRDSEEGEESFIVRRTWWNLNSSKSGNNLKNIVVEAEFAEGAFMDSASHKLSLETYASRGFKVKTFDKSTY
ncbi:hypothetical protein [Anabaena sp. PCC 7108]|uniref:hypothetical protein n=1 Tax=Anabaena sp. PCC 7108 TaxID=163908 RepID=UPI000345DB01|nr:hypothetical protein [Anabaena sp. PCC 7108]